jgi:uncharacterized protein (TIGR02246 family)
MAQPGSLTLEDKEAIRELTARYSHAVDNGDPDGVLACFVEDGWFKAYRHLVGHAELRKLGEERTPARIPRHVVTNVLIQGRVNEPDIADVKCHLLSYGVTSSGIEFRTSGVYEDVVVKVNGEWKYRSRLVTIDKVPAT